jgi:hydroxymethylglutaryl-CoA lyase
MKERASATIVEVGPRDGFQSIGPFIPTDDKIALIAELHAAGVRRMEVTSFVSESALPQLRDAAEVLAAASQMQGLDPHVLVPTQRHADRAFAAGARHIAFVLSVSEWHNQSNVRRSRRDSCADYGRIVATMPAGTKVRLNLATAFDCPKQGRIAETAVLDLLDDLVVTCPKAEIALCDTTGRATPAQVAGLFGRVQARYPMTRRWAFHGHDTYGVGIANVAAAWGTGVSVFDSSCAGLGGCPFAPGATGNVATEDVVWMFEAMGIDTGISIEPLLDAARRAADFPGAQIGGRVRDALAARGEGA